MMLMKDLFEKWGLTNLKVNAGIMEMEWQPKTADQDAAWDMYVELLTRITTQPLPNEDGVEKTALESIHKLFDITREILHRHGRKCQNFTRVAIIILNQIIRPFTARWHRLSEDGAFEKPEQRAKFREELKTLQIKLGRYAQLLAAIAKVEDMTALTTAR